MMMETSQEELINLIIDLTLSKDNADLLASHLKNKHLVHKDVLIYSYHKQNLDLVIFFITGGPPFLLQ